MKKIRVAQVGTWRYTHAEHIMMSMRSMPHIFEVVGVCEPDPAKRELAQKKETYRGLRWMTLEEVLADDSLDAVTIETYEPEQATYAIPFAEKGVHIHLEKPGGGSVEEFERLISLVKSRGSLLQLGYMYRYNPAIMEAMNIIAEGKLGEVVRMDAQMSICYGRAMLDMLGDFPGGMMYYLGCHLVDLMYRILGQPRQVIPMNSCSGTLGTEALDSGLVAYRYDRGVSTLKTMAFEVGGGSRRGMVIAGTRGSIELKNFEVPMVAPPITNANSVTMTAQYYPENQPTVLYTEEKTFSPYGRYDLMMSEFAKMVAGEKQNPYTPDYELALFRLLAESTGMQK